MTPSIEDKVRRPVKYLTAVTQRYPGIWKRVDLLRANRDKVQQEHPWPSWCYLPVGGAGAVLGPQPERDHHFHREVHCIATLASWRLAKDLYLFDETVFEELWETPIAGDIPVEVLYKLPTFCAYVAFPGPRDVEGGAAHGFFVHLNYFREPVVMLALDYGTLEQIGPGSLAPFTVDLQEGRSLLQCLTTKHEMVQAKVGPAVSSAIEEVVKPERIMRWIEPLLSLTIYLCSASAEIRARDPLRGLKGKAYTKKTKKGVRTFVPDQPQVWEVAYRIGATLRAATAAAASRGTGEGGTHASPRPHMRKAHWHSYWTGPKAAVGKASVPAREVVVKWIPPIAVAMGPDDEAIPTVHRVTR